VKRRILITIALLLLLPLLLFTWLTTTESGLRWAYHQAVPYLPTALQMDQLHGQLSGPVVIKGLQWRQDGALIKAAELTLDWSPAALLGANIHISRLHVQQLEILLPADGSTDAGPQQPLSLPDIRLPWRIKGFSYNSCNWPPAPCSAISTLTTWQCAAMVIACSWTGMFTPAATTPIS